MSFEEEEIAILATSSNAENLLNKPQRYTVVGKCYGCSNDIELFKDFITWYNSKSGKGYEERFFPVIRTLSYYFKNDNSCLSKNNFYSPEQISNIQLSQGKVSPYIKCYGVFAFYTEFTFKNFVRDDMQRQIGEELFNKNVGELDTLTFTTYTPPDVIFNQDLKIGIFKKGNQRPVLTLDRDCYFQDKVAKTIYRQSEERDMWRARALMSIFGSVGSVGSVFGSAVGSVGSVFGSVFPLPSPPPPPSPTPPPLSSSLSPSPSPMPIDEFNNFFNQTPNKNFYLKEGNENKKITSVYKQGGFNAGKYSIIFEDGSHEIYESNEKISYTMQGGKPLTKRHRKKRQNKKRKSRKSKK
jgi:hypothetical protein